MFLDRFIAIASPVAALRRAIRLIEVEQFAAAFPLLTRAAKAGIPEAEYHVARSYLEGVGVPRSQAEGARWLERAASHGWLEALTLLAALCVRGLAGATGAPSVGRSRADRLFSEEAPATPDFTSALKWARQA